MRSSTIRCGRDAGRGRFPAPAKLRHVRRVRHRAAWRSARPCCGSGLAGAAQQAERFGEEGRRRPRHPARKTAACRGPGRCSSAFSANRRVSSIQATSGITPGVRNSNQPGTGGRGRRLQPCTTRPVGDQQPAARHIGDFRGRVMRTGIRDDHFAHRAGRRAGNERRQRRQQRPLAVMRGDHHAQHIRVPRVCGAQLLVNTRRRRRCCPRRANGFGRQKPWPPCAVSMHCS